MITQILFYIFSIILILASLGATLSKNTAYSVFFLIVCFFNAAGLFIILQAEFLAMLLIIVYVGAVALLFLFVVMMLNLDDEKTKNNTKKLGLYIVGFCILFSAILYPIAKYDFTENTHSSKIYMKNKYNQKNNKQENNKQENNKENSKQETNSVLIAKELFTNYNIHLILVAVILMNSLIGAVLLNRTKRKNIKRQNGFVQTNVKKQDIIRLVEK